MALLASAAVHVLLVTSVSPSPAHEPPAPEEAGRVILLEAAKPPAPEPEPVPEPEPEPRPEPRPEPKRNPTPDPEPLPKPELSRPSPPTDAPPETPASERIAEPGPSVMTAPVPGPGDAFARGPGGAGSGPPSTRREGPTTAPPLRPPPDAVVALANLSSPPRPPSLNAALRRLYPEEARRAGRGGEATVRARIGPGGAVAETRLEATSEPAFGAACSSLLRRSRWSPPLDRGGRPVSTWIRYTCRFAADR